MGHAFTVTFDYRCPFAYNGNAAVVRALQGGADHDVRFAVFSLDQNHAALTDEDAPPVWERPPAERGSGVLALLYGIAVRDHDPDRITDLAHDPATLATLAAEHTEMVRDHSVFGVPTFVAHGQATFVRFMERGNVDDLERMLDLLAWSNLNEFKRTTLPY